MIRRWRDPVVAALAIGWSTTGDAQTIDVNLPPGTLGIAVERIALQARASIVLADPVLWSRRTPAIRGRRSVEATLRLLARATQARLTRLGASGWKLLQRPAPVTAQPLSLRPPRSLDDEIVVIGSKRGTTVGSFAVATEQLTDVSRGTQAGTEAVVRQSTIVSSTFFGAGREKLFIRGIADSSFSGQAQSVTGLYFGDLRLGYNASDPDLLLYDVASVEILPGPQGTLYGSGSLGGIVRLNPQAPVLDSLSGEIGMGLSAMAHGAPGADAMAILNLPFAGNAAMRLVGYAWQEGGYVDRPTNHRDVNRTRIGGGRATIRWAFAPGWTADAIGMLQSIRASDSYYGSAADPLVNEQELAEPFGSRYRASHVVVAGPIGDLRLTSSTGVVRQVQDTRADAQSNTTVQAIFDARRTNDLVLHETRIARHGTRGEGWVAGIGHTRSRTVLDQSIVGVAGPAAARIVNRVTELAVYGEGAVRLTPFLLAGAGGRLAVAEVGAHVGSPPTETVAPQRQYWVLPSASVVADIVDGLSAFGRYQQAVRPGSVVAGQGSISERVRRDRLSAIEVGARFDRPERLNGQVSASWSRWRDIQADYTLDGFNVYTATIGDGRIFSLTGRLDWPLASRWSVHAAATANDSRLIVPSSPSSPGVVTDLLADNRSERIPNVADLIGRLAVRYHGPIGNNLILRAEGWGRYEGNSQAVVGTQSFGVQGGYALLGVNAAVARDADKMTFAIDNLLDDRATRFLLGSPVLPGQRRPTSLRPLTVRIGFSRQF